MLVPQCCLSHLCINYGRMGTHVCVNEFHVHNDWGLMIKEEALASPLDHARGNPARSFFILLQENTPPEPTELPYSTTLSLHGGSFSPSFFVVPEEPVYIHMYLSIALTATVFKGLYTVILSLKRRNKPKISCQNCTYYCFQCPIYETSFLAQPINIAPSITHIDYLTRPHYVLSP